MIKEIELKAHVDDWESLLKRIRKSPKISEEKYGVKEDIYFFNPLINQSFRVRREVFNNIDDSISKKTVFTTKEKIIVDGIEQNNEVEISLNYEKFEDSILFFEKLGFSQTYKKEKSGYSFLFHYFNYPLHVELLQVDHLGWFFEIEFVVEEELDEDIVNILVNNLYKTLDIFKIPHSKIEKRYYSELLGKD